MISYKKLLVNNNIELPTTFQASNEEIKSEFGEAKTNFSPGKKNGGANQAVSGRQMKEFEYQIREYKIEGGKKDKKMK